MTNRKIFNKTKTIVIGILKCEVNYSKYQNIYQYFCEKNNTTTFYQNQDDEYIQGLIADYIIANLSSTKALIEYCQYKYNYFFHIITQETNTHHYYLTNLKKNLYFYTKTIRKIKRLHYKIKKQNQDHFWKEELSY